MSMAKASPSKKNPILGGFDHNDQRLLVVAELRGKPRLYWPYFFLGFFTHRYYLTEKLTSHKLVTKLFAGINYYC